MPVFLERGVREGCPISPFCMFWSKKSCQLKFANVQILKVSSSLEPGLFNLKSHNMPMMLLYSSKLNILSVAFCKLSKCMKAVWELSLTSPNPKPCGCGDGGVMA